MKWLLIRNIISKDCIAQYEIVKHNIIWQDEI